MKSLNIYKNNSKN